MNRQFDKQYPLDPKSSLEEEDYLDGLQTSGRRHGPSLDVRVPSLKVVANGGIIAVPGLGADPGFTWTKKVEVSPGEPLEGRDATKSKSKDNDKDQKAHLLLLLKQAFPKARILCYVDNTAWFREPIIKTPRQIGIWLQEKIKAKRLSSRLPVIFIGHSLGGIIIKEALSADPSKSIIGDTVGIIFLGTPHQGARLVRAAALLAPVPKRFGLVDDTLIKYLTEHNCDLSNLADSFDKLRSQLEERDHKIRIAAFYESKPVPGTSKTLVSRDSAIVHADAFEKWPVNTDHSNLNKFSGVQDSYFVDLTKAIARLRYPSRLQLADSMIHNQHYNANRLKITRLLGNGVDLSQCYINLTIEQKPFGQDKHFSQEKPFGQESAAKRRMTTDSPFQGLASRDKVEGLDGSRELDLKTIFSQRIVNDGAVILPRRIMIRGRAGVGKSTLCKKMVHDFVHNETWRELFHRILWIPLRHLARTDRRMKSGYCLLNLFQDEFFPEHRELAEELARDWSTKRGKTLFVLDGLDEVSQVLESEQSGMKDFIARLLGQPNLIVTSRSHVSHPALDNVDLRAEVLGFHPDQVVAYLEADPNMCSKIDEFQTWLNERWILHDLGMLVELMASLESKDQVLVIAAAMALGSQMDLSADTEEILLALLKGNVKAVSNWASRALADKETISETTQSVLLQIVKKHSYQDMRELAAETLARIYKLSDTILTELAEIIACDESLKLTEFALYILSGQRTREVSGPIQDILIEKFQCVPDLRHGIARILSRQTTLSEKASTTLKRAFGDKSNSEHYRLHAINSFEYIMDLPCPTVVALSQLVTDDSQSWNLREAAAAILHYDHSSPAAMEDLHRLLEHDNDIIQCYALFALMNRDSDCLTAAKLFTLLRNYDSEVASLAIHYFKASMKLGPSEEKVLVRIMSDAKSRSSPPSWRCPLICRRVTFEYGVAEVLAGQTRLSDQTQNSLLRRLRDLEYGWWVRYLAATALGGQLSYAKAALLLQVLDKRVLDDVCQIASAMAQAPALVNVILKLVESHANAEKLTEIAVPASVNVKLITGLYEDLLNRSFTEQVTLCVYDNVCVIDQPQGRFTVPLNDFELDSLRSNIARRQQLISKGSHRLWCRCE
ncbi:hypothetical protein ACQRIU_000651 [Beauveria bassiana]